MKSRELLFSKLFLSIIRSRFSEATLIFWMDPVEELCLVAWMPSGFASCRIPEECSGKLAGRTVEPSSTEYRQSCLRCPNNSSSASHETQFRSTGRFRRDRFLQSMRDSWRHWEALDVFQQWIGTRLHCVRWMHLGLSG